MNEQDEYYHRLNLIHITPVECADSIIQEQKFHVGGGLFGQGVYFGNTLEACQKKVKHHQKKNPGVQIQWTYLVADVYVGKAKPILKKYAKNNPVNTQLLISQGYNSVIGHGLVSGREFVVFDANRIHNIKYIYGSIPHNFFPIKRKRIVLFYVTSSNEAHHISGSQIIPKKNGPFGNAIYLYYTITDAKQQCQISETILACEVHLYDFYELKKNETLNSKFVISKRFRSFTGVNNHVKLYIFTDPSLVFNVHYCGGKTWN